MVTTSLLIVSTSMPPKLQQLPRVLRLVSDFLQPKTLDVAVHRNLQRVIIAHGNSRPCTGRALDFAAAHGHLGVLRMSRASRRGRFSSAALTGAAANGHLDVVKWLSKKLRAVKNRHLYLDEALRAAAVNGHVEVVRFLRTRCGQPAITFALQLAAGRNQVSVVKMLLPWMFVPPDSHYVHCHEIPETKERTRWPSRTAWGTQLPDYVAVRDIPPMEAAINAAASNGHVETVELLLKMESSYELYGLAGIKSTEEEDTGLTNETAAEEEEDSSYALYGLADVTTAVEDATINGHLAVVQLLVESHNPCSTTFALLKATASGDIEAVKLLVHRSDWNVVVRATCLAMDNNQDEVAKFLLLKGGLGSDMRGALLERARERARRTRGAKAHRQTGKGGRANCV